MSTIPVEREARPLVATPTTSGWLVGPLFDVLFLANAFWPLLLLIQLSGGFDARAGVEFWQMYFVTTPHRWITLPLVFLDRQRFRERQTAFLAVLVTTIVACLAVRGWTGRLTCLLAVDYVWNAWHFAAQHHGIYRIYGRMSQPERTAGLMLEKVALRLFLLYVILRVAGGTWSNAEFERWLERVDWAALVIPIGLILQELAVFRRASAGRLVYLLSVCGLYLSLLWAAHTHRPGLVLMLATASALFHAIEYLSIVGWQVHRRAEATAPSEGALSRSLLARLAPHWGLTLASFMVVLGLGGWMVDRHLMELWLTLNVIAAFLHYAYDGMIWKHRRAGSQIR